MAKQKQVVSIFDLDDSIQLFTDTLIYLSNTISGTIISPEDVGTWDLPKELEDVYKRFEKCGLYAVLPMSPFAIETLTFLRTVKSHKIVLLTARPENYGEATYLNLLLNKVPFDELIFNKNKVEAIKKLSKKYHISLFADDKLETIQRVYTNCNVDTVCLIDRKHNRVEDLDPDIKRITNLLETLKYIKE